MPFFVALTTLFVIFAAHAETSIPKEVQQISDKFNLTMMKCPQKIWSDYNWSGLKVVLVYPSTEKSWVWNATNNSLETIVNSSLPTSVLGSTYEFFEIAGQAAMSLNMEEEGEHVELGIHEFFHNQGQKDWTSENLGASRGTEFPLSWQPRFYRRMIFDNLKKYFQLGQPGDLSRAKYWYEKWSTEYPKEVVATADGYEGTSQYVQTVATAIVTKGCEATDAQLKEALLPKVSEFGFTVSGEDLALDSEGYEIGALAALILRFSNANLREWNQKMSKGATPLEVLMAGVKPTPENSLLAATFQQAAKNANSEWGEILNPSIANWANKDFVRVTASYALLQSNLMPSFFAHSSFLDMLLYPLSEEHHYISSKGSNFKIKANSVNFDMGISICAGQYPFVLVPATSIKQTGKHAEVASPTVNGLLVGELKTDQQGYKYFCVE